MTDESYRFPDPEKRAALIAQFGTLTVDGIYHDPEQAQRWLAMSEKERAQYEWNVLRDVNEDGHRYLEQNPGEAVGYNTWRRRFYSDCANNRYRSHRRAGNRIAPAPWIAARREC